MHTITGIYVSLCPSSLPPAMLSGKTLRPPVPWAWGLGVSWQNEKVSLLPISTPRFPELS